MQHFSPVYDRAFSNVFMKLSNKKMKYDFPPSGVSNGNDPVESFVTDEAVFVFSPGFFETFLLYPLL